VVQIYVRQPDATVPVPSIRLAAFERVPSIAPNEQRTVSLIITPEFHSAVLDGTDIYQPTIDVQKGTLNIYVGGGQPDFFPGHLLTSVAITNTQPLDNC